jgi:hypothetical protein
VEAEREGLGIVAEKKEEIIAEVDWKGRERYFWRNSEIRMRDRRGTADIRVDADNTGKKDSRTYSTKRSVRS